MIELLRHVKLFDQLKPDELQDVAKICERISCKSGDRIFEAESPAEYLYVVGNGSVELRFNVTHYHASKEITLDRKFNGDTFGWSALTEHKIYTLSALAMQDSELLRLRAEDMTSLSNDNNSLGYILMKNLTEVISSRFVSLQRVLIDVIRQNLQEKEL
ncbi:MAG: Crp/Fnr family transcriptional regulator [bacterium]